MAKNRSQIPLCRSKFLQDVTIALGRRSLKSLRQAHPTLTFVVAFDEVEGSKVERLDVEARTLSGRLTKVTLWEDGVSWVYSRERATKAPSHPLLEIHADFAGMDAEEVAELLRTTLSDLPSAEKKWRGRAKPL
jgi:hypothetical protein